MSFRAAFSSLKHVSCFKIQPNPKLDTQATVSMTSKDSQRPLLLLLDWDGTLTTTTTLPLIASIATFPTIHPKLAALTKAYAEDFKAHDASYSPAKQDRVTIAQELHYLNSLLSVEKSSIERVEASGIFKDVGTGDIETAAADVVESRSITLRNGWARLVEVVQSSQGPGKVGIVSVAWSRRFISRVLALCGRMEGGADVHAGDVEIRANEIEGDASGRLERCLGNGRGIWTAGDKVELMDGLVDAFMVMDSGRVDGGVDRQPKVIYIGDSTTDLACLLKAEVGICVRDKPLGEEQRGLKETLVRIGVACLHVGKFVKRGRDVGGMGGRNRLWWATDFHEVCESGILGS